MSRYQKEIRPGSGAHVYIFIWIFLTTLVLKEYFKNCFLLKTREFFVDIFHFILREVFIYSFSTKIPSQSSSFLFSKNSKTNFVVKTNFAKKICLKLELVHKNCTVSPSNIWNIDILLLSKMYLSVKRNFCSKCPFF